MVLSYEINLKHDESIKYALSTHYEDMISHILKTSDILDDFLYRYNGRFRFVIP